MNCRAQLSSETLIVSLVILAMGVAIVSQYFPLKDSTTAMEMLKIGALKKIDSMQEKYAISKIDYVIAGSAISLCIYTAPSSGFEFSTEEGGEEDTIKGAIAGATGFTTGDITIWENPSSCA